MGKITYGDKVYLFGVFPIITGVLKMAIIIVPAICKGVNPLRTQQHMHAACSTCMQHAAQAVAHAGAPAVAQAAHAAHACSTCMQHMAYAAAQAVTHAAAHIAASGRA